MENIEVPIEHLYEQAGAEFKVELLRLQGALQVDVVTVFMSLVSLTSFQCHGTVAQYTKMLGIPPLPWMGLTGRPGLRKSIIIWLCQCADIEAFIVTKIVFSVTIAFDTK